MYKDRCRRENCKKKCSTLLQQIRYTTQQYWSKLHDTVAKILENSNSSRTIIFTFELVSLGKIWTNMSIGCGFNIITTVLKGYHHHHHHHHHHHSRHAINTDIPDPLLPTLPIIHFFRQVFRATSRIYTELLYVGSSWPSCLCSFIWWGPQ